MRPQNPIGEPLTELSETDSTNNHAMTQVQAQLAGHGATFFTWYQHAGKGQRGKIWTATRGENIMLSAVLEPTALSIENQFLLTMAMALGAYDFFYTYAIDDVKIKWANDIYWKDRKAGGILIENIIQGREWKYAIVGIGLNINQTLFADALKNPVSLKQITGKTFDVLLLIKELCWHLEKRWQQLLANPSLIVEDYNQCLFRLNERVTLKKQAEVFNAVVKGVTAKGELLINDNRERLTFGSVEWML